MNRHLQNRDSNVFHWGNVPYRYTFNAKETDTECDLQDYGMRIYNPRLGKFLSVDPIASQYPDYTPYLFAANTPILAIDLDGLAACKPPANRPANYYRTTSSSRTQAPSSPQRHEMYRTPLQYQPRVRLPGGIRSSIQPPSLANGEPHDGGYTNPTRPSSMAWFKLVDLGQNIITTNNGSDSPTQQNQSGPSPSFVMLDISVTEYVVNTIDQRGETTGSKTILVVSGPGAQEFYTKQQQWETAFNTEVDAQVNKEMQNEWHQNNPNAPAVSQPKFSQEEIDTWKANNWTKVQLFRSAANFKLGPSPRDQLAEQVAEKKKTGELKAVNTSRTSQGVIH